MLVYDNKNDNEVWVVGDAIRSKRVMQSVLVLGGMAAISQVFATPLFGPVDSSGYLGYYYRSVVTEGGQTDSSNQLGGAINAHTYLIGPWLATSSLSLNITQDSSESKGGVVEENASSQLITGDLGVNVLSSSRTPFVFQLQATDSRVDSERTGSTPITYVGQEYSTLYLGLRQSYLTGNGGRYLASFDSRSWSSEGGSDYEDQTVRLEADLRAPRQHFIGRGSIQNNENIDSGLENNSQLVDLSHFYYPVRDFRVDSKVSLYEYERAFIDPSASDTRMSNLSVSQLSSNAFWRPNDYPLSMNAGLRVYTMDGLQSGVDGNDISQVAFNTGLFYNASQNLRFDASLASTFGETGGLEDSVHQQQFGALYQTDWAEVLGFMYQAYLDGDMRHRVDIDDEKYSWVGAAGHGLGRTWWASERVSNTSLRLNLSQALNYHGSIGSEVKSANGFRLDHAATLAFNQRVWGGNTLAQIIVSDTRNYTDTNYAGYYEDTIDEQQLINFQLSRDQDLGRRSSITGDITVQYIRQRGETDTGAAEAVVEVAETTTTTSTGRIMYAHNQLFGVPRLQFASDYMISNISTEGAIDRQDWDNRLSYMIGKLNTSLSYRLTETDSRNYDLLYFRVMRRF